MTNRRRLYGIAAHRVVPGLIALVLVLVTPAGPDGPAKPAWTQASPGYAWSFPEDHGPHRDYAIEWWYLTGHLVELGNPEQRFGYQFTIFRIGLSPGMAKLDSDWAASQLLMGHAAVTDKTRGEHRFAEMLYREAKGLAAFGEAANGTIARSLGPAGTADEWTLAWTGDGFRMLAADDRQGFSFGLHARRRFDPVLHGLGGYSAKSADGESASQYYSFTRLATSGEVELAGRRYRVSGTSWMDHEFSTSHLSERQVGWDWFSLQLDDGRDLMFYLLRSDDDRVDHAAGTLVRADRSTRTLGAAEWSLRATGRWSSPESGIAYPSGWNLELPGESLALTLVPQPAAQENRSLLPAGPSYWEGAVEVREADGRRVGTGYVELTGYGENNRPPV